MASKDDVSSETLSEMFKKGISINDDLEKATSSPNSDDYQHKVRKGIMILEDATRLVSLLDLFSRNETVSEVPTEHLKYFLLPAILGSLNSKLFDQDRMEMIKIIETYYIDFLDRIRDYEIANVPKIRREKEKTESKPDPKKNLAKMNHERDEKIRRYKESKALEESLNELKLAIDRPSCDEDILRDYYIKMIRKFSFNALDELNSFETEKEILEHMNKMRASGASIQPNTAKPKRPLRPIIITRDAVQKEVFGLGYKNLPVMSIEEFYDQRVRDGWFHAPRSNQGSLQDRAVDSEANGRLEEEEAAKKEELEENDDPDELARKRNFDEYKDEHKRGEGNRHNKG